MDLCSVTYWLLLSAAAALLLLTLLRIVTDGFVAFVVDSLRRVPFIRRLIAAALRREAVKLVTQDFDVFVRDELLSIPAVGSDAATLTSKLATLKTQSINKMFAYVYSNIDDLLHKSVQQLQHTAAGEFLQDEQEASTAAQWHLSRQFAEAFMHENALNPGLFRTLRMFEVELVQMTADLLHADGSARGNVTSGGTESIIMAVKAYRDLARSRWASVKCPNIVASTTAHPAFNKAAHYLGLEIRQVAVDAKSLTASAAQLEAEVDSNTILLVASAPQYCHGIVDPVEDYGRLAQRLGIGLHVDACFGGFMLPWLEKLGYPVPVFDFRVSGVTSMSADLHKYGYAPKGTSVIIYRSANLRKHQLFAFSKWPGGLFGSPTMAGTRPGAPLAAAWATVKLLGQEGYLTLAQQIMQLTEFWIHEIKDIEPLKILGSPHMTCFAVVSTDSSLCVYLLADLMEERGWKMEREMNPNCLHVTVMPHHVQHKQLFVNDLRESVKRIRSESLQPKGLAAVYGMVAKVPAKELVDEFLLEFFNQIYS